MLAGKTVKLQSNVSPVTRKARTKKHSWIAYLFLLPTFVSIVIFSYYPAIRALMGAFTDWDGFNSPQFIGFQNFSRLFHDPVFLASLWHILIWTVIGIPLSILPSFAVAELIFHLRGQRSQYVYRTVFILAMVIPGVVVILLWEFIYQPSGILNQLFQDLGLSSWKREWLANPHYALGSLIGLGFPWVNPFNLLILYAGLQSIPVELMDAASVDGVGLWNRIFKIDIPLVTSQFKLLLILAIVGVSQNLLTPMLLTGGGPGTSTVTPVFYMYQTSIDYGQYGYGMSVAFLIFLFVGILAVVNMKYVQSSD
ncbi:carbohydrate ABC transporter permease [Alicyclobacillus fodiniaquatilis]|jgi:ABC-type sugar transport system permease subunit|uniref:Carbohydrate ABC transporter permease n=1 Tax=Alicyclobacillus fodiniaquatilis TaxID=1661150 RepID=A0ABW4JN95_9BACL